ncbi:MAG: QcrA and Rieske domain-containing protein [Planctomycetota bacterium]|jgi:nitrite reductase/ring-hydroxylating ferredoxin subunit
MSVSDSDPKDTPQPDRRKFLGAASRTAMAGGLVAGYGTFFAYAGRYLYPARPPDKAWMFVADLTRVPQGSSMNFRLPSGASVVVTRQGAGDTADDFLALSSTCPHLGCQVHWVQADRHFFCPCHNGIFDTSGKGIAGPPGEAGQNLPKYPLKVESGLLYIEVEAATLASAPPDGGRDGHDPCLNPRNEVS